ncbi:MAG: hypothetical protein R3D55_21065 [Chloroflexota bacterium]
MDELGEGGGVCLEETAVPHLHHKPLIRHPLNQPSRIFKQLVAGFGVLAFGAGVEN